MNPEEFMYAVDTQKTVDEAAVAVLREVEKAGWTVFNVYDVSERLSAKGFVQRPLKIIEICSGKYANEFLNQNRFVSLCMPCKINVFEMDGKTVIAGMNPVLVASFFPEISREQAEPAARDLKAMIDAAK
ncbi:MAG: DUF302 domain-containing protein [Candidatus Micrarchaeota archaeon]|nr:DUF302 domain-containing protein [Candidatus Micrarchaeota archaeon]